MDSSSSLAEAPDPFALPSETDAHFTLLIVSVIGSSVLLYTMLFNVIPPFWDAKQAEIQRCAALVATAIPGNDITLEDQRIELRAACERPIRVAQAAWELGGCVLLVAVGLGLFWWLPSRTRRRSGFRDLPRADHPDLVASVDGLAREMGLARTPRIVCNPLHRSGGGVAFGRWGQRYLGLYAGTLLRFRRQPELFRGVVLHELAHLRNADVDKATLAVTVWWAFLLAAVVPVTVGSLLAGILQPDRSVALWWRLLVASALVAFTRAAVLRERELYADQRAWLIGAQGLDDALGQLTPPVARTRLRLPAVLQRALALHPTPAERLAALDEPAALFRFSPWTAFAAGMASTLALESVGQVMFGLVPVGLASAVPAFVLALPLAGVLALSVWRDEMYSSHRRTPAGRLATLGLGLALGAGLVAGWHASLTFFAYETSPFRLTGAQAVVFEAGLVVICLASMALFLCWLRAGARAWLPRVARRRHSIRLGLAGATLATAVVLSAVLSYLSHGVLSSVASFNALDPTVFAPLAEMGLPVPELSSERAVLVLSFGIPLLQLTWAPQAPLIFALIWAYPLAAGVLPRAPPSDRPHWRLVCIASLTLGVLIVPAFVVLSLAFVDTSNVVAYAIAGQCVFGLFQAGAAVLVRARVNVFGIWHALAAAHLTGLVAVAVLLGLAAAAGSALPWNVVASVATGGLLVAGTVVLVLEPVFGRGRTVHLRGAVSASG